MCEGPGSATSADLGHQEEGLLLVSASWHLLLPLQVTLGMLLFWPSPRTLQLPKLSGQLPCSLTPSWVRLVDDQQDIGEQENRSKGTDLLALSLQSPSNWLRPLIKDHRSIGQQSADSWCLPVTRSTLSLVPPSPGE